MAGAGYKLFNTGDVLTAAQVNTYLQEQAVMRFANSTARTTALSGVLAEGMMSYLDDTNSVEVYNGSAWVSVGSTGDITEVLAGTGISGGGTSGSVTITNSMATAIDAKGDLIVGTGADTFSRLAVGGTNGHVLTVDSGQATGIKWAASASGGLTLLDTVTLSGSSTTSATFSSAYTYLVFYFKNIYGSAGETSLKIRFNGDTGNNYAWAFLVIGGSEVQTGTSNIRIGSVNTQSATLERTNATVQLWRPSDTDVVFVEANAVYRSASNPQWSNTSAIYDNSAAITSLTAFVDSGTFTAGTVFIYGSN